jgi:hypothetical protein
MFELITGFINNLLVVTTNNYYSITNLHNLQSLHTNLFSLFPLDFTIRFLAAIYNSGTIKVSVNYTLPISMYYSTCNVIHYVFYFFFRARCCYLGTSELKSSQFPFPHSSISSRHGPRTENTDPLSLHGADHTENTCHVSDCEFIGSLSAMGVARTT